MIKKLSFSLLLLMSSGIKSGYSQIDICNLFQLNIRLEKIQDRFQNHITIDLNKNYRGASYKEISKHTLSFEYLLLNFLTSAQTYTRYYPDTLTTNAVFCQDLNSNMEFKSAVAVLLNQPDARIRIHQNDIMAIASRFFYVDTINPVDSSVSAHICQGLNGQRELHKSQAYLAIEAFCFEAIRSTMNTKKCKYIEHLNTYKKFNSKSEKTQFRSFEMIIEYLRNRTYQLMEKDEELKKAVLGYYHKNKKDFGIEIFDN